MRERRLKLCLNISCLPAGLPTLQMQLAVPMVIRAPGGLFLQTLSAIPQVLLPHQPRLLTVKATLSRFLLRPSAGRPYRAISLGLMRCV